MSVEPPGNGRGEGGGARENGGRERREQILQATWRVLAQVGFEKITTRRIAEAAGINIATLHYHFGSKEAVLTDTLRYAQRWADQELRATIADAPTAVEALNRSLSHLWTLMRARPGDALRFDLVVRAFRDADAKREALNVYGAYRQFFKEIVERHVAEGGTLAPQLTPETLADYLVTVLDGVILHHTLSRDDAAAGRNLEMIRGQVLQLMGVSSKEEVTATGMD